MQQGNNMIWSTDSTKINRPGHSIRMYWTNLWQPTVHVQQNVFEKTQIEGCSPHLYASFGTFCVQIGQLFAAQWVFEKYLKTVKWLFLKEYDVNFEFFRKFMRVFQKYFVAHEQSAVKNSFSTYVCYAPDGLFWLNLYI